MGQICNYLGSLDWYFIHGRLTFSLYSLAVTQINVVILPTKQIINIPTMIKPSSLHRGKKCKDMLQ